MKCFRNSLFGLIFIAGCGDVTQQNQKTPTVTAPPSPPSPHPAADLSKDGAKLALEAALDKWIKGDPDLMIRDPRFLQFGDLESYQIKSVVDDSVSGSEHRHYIISAELEFRGKGGTPVKKIQRYDAFWNPAVKKEWDLASRTTAD
jgi:hypothetical protein